MTLGRTRTRRDVLLGGLGCAVAGALSRPAIAQTSWPTKAVKVVVPYAAGGGADTMCRLLCGHLQEALGQPFVIDNRGGGGGTIGAAAAAKAEPDGYTVLYDATAFSINPALLPALPYDSAKDFVPVFLAGVVPNLLVVNPSVPQSTVAEIVAAAKSANGLDWRHPETAPSSTCHLSCSARRPASNSITFPTGEARRPSTISSAAT